MSEMFNSLYMYFCDYSEMDVQQRREEYDADVLSHDVHHVPMRQFFSRSHRTSRVL